MAIEWTTEHEGETHLFSSDLSENDEFSHASCDEWVEFQSDEMKAAWSAYHTTNEPTEASNAVYFAWIQACKITHTVKTGDTVKFTNSYTDAPAP